MCMSVCVPGTVWQCERLRAKRYLYQISQQTDVSLLEWLLLLLLLMRFNFQNTKRKLVANEPHYI